MASRSFPDFSEVLGKVTSSHRPSNAAASLCASGNGEIPGGQGSAESHIGNHGVVLEDTHRSCPEGCSGQIECGRGTTPGIWVSAVHMCGTSSVSWLGGLWRYRGEGSCGFESQENLRLNILSPDSRDHQPHDCTYTKTDQN